MRNTPSGRDGRQSFRALASTLIILLALSQATASSVAPPIWPTLGGNMQRSGLSPNAGPTIGCVKWTFDTAAPPASHTNSIYAPAGLNSSAVLGSDGTIYFTSDNGCLYALNPSGELLWKYAFQPQVKQTWQWPLNETTGLVAHASAGGLDAELVNFADPNFAHWVPDDRFGRALQFDGIDDKVTIAGFKGVSGSLPRRVSAWVNTTAAATNPILHWGNAASALGAWRLELTADGKPAVVAQGSAVADIAVNTGQWMHIEAILPQGGFQAADIVLIINGQKATTTVTAGSPNWINTDTLCDVVIGWNPIAAKSFSGLMADVRIEELDSGSRTVSGPTIGPDGLIYAAYGSTLHAITPDGELLWSYPTGAFINGAPAVTAAGTVVFGSADGKIYGVNRAEGYEWILDGLYDAHRPVITAPTLALDGSILVGSVYDATLYALDPADGHIRWVSNLDPGAGHSAKSFVASPVVAPDGTIYAVLAGDANLYAINPADGAVLRTTNMAHTPELVGYWKFDETGGYALSNSAPDGFAATPLTGGDPTLRWFPGQVNGAFSSANFTVNNFPWPAKTAARTITAWVHYRTLDIDVPQGNIVGWVTSPKAETWVLRVNNTDHRVYLGINNGYLVGNRQLNDSEWHHIAVVLTPIDSPAPTKYTNLDMAQIYIDGVLDADKNSNHGLVLSTNSIGSGSADQTATVVLRGTNADKISWLVIDELRLYNTALTLQELQEIAWTQTDFTLHDPLPATGMYKDRSGWVEPVVGPDGTVYVALDDQYLRAVRTDGTIAWTKYLGEKGSYSIAVTPDNRIFAAGEEGHLFVLDAAGQYLADINTQALVLRWDATKKYSWGSSLVGYPVIAPDGTIYLSDSYNRLWAIDNESCQTPGATLAWPEFRKANISPDLRIDLSDFAAFAAEWLKCTTGYSPCQTPPWKYVAKTYPWRDFLTADINQDAFVDLDDLALIMEQWMMGN